MIVYSKAVKTDIAEITMLIERVFGEFIGNLYTKEGKEEFYKYIQEASFHQRFKDNIIFLARFSGRIIGVIELRNHNHISLFFVDSKYQKQGIGRKLLDHILKECKKENPNIDQINVHSSPNAVPVYQKLGFKESGEEKVEHGIRYTPMVMQLQ